MYDMLKPGGILIIDHRNYDYILKNGQAPKKNIYYNSQNIKSIKTQIIYEDNKPRQIVLDYKMDVEGDGDFVLSYQPWTLAEFSNLLKVCDAYLEKLVFTKNSFSRVSLEAVLPTQLMPTSSSFLRLWTPPFTSM